MRGLSRPGAYVGVLCCLCSGVMGQAIGGPGTFGEAGGDLSAPAGGGSVKIISGVPSYIWYHGCGPTAAGMIIGYWDARGFGDLISGSNNWTTNQQAVKDMIASSGHIADYVPTPDRTPPPPYHADDCVADFMGASRDPFQYGWSYLSKQDDGLEGYAKYCGYNEADAYNVYYASLWDSFVAEIDAGRPVEFLVDSKGDGATDHFVTVIGYASMPGDLKYCCYNTWDHYTHWYSYRRMSSDYSWGVYGATFFQAPEPTVLVLLGLGAPWLAGRGRGARR